jgi:hypothetical protein
MTIGLLNFEPSSIQCAECVSVLYDLFETNFLNLLHPFEMPCILRWIDIKMMGCGGMSWIELNEDSDQ